MSILTKICVVVLLVLILLAVPTFISQATVPPNYRHAYEQEVMRSKLYEMDAKSEKLAHQTTQAERDRLLGALNTTEIEKQREIDRLTGELAAAQTKAAGLQIDLSRLTTEVAGLKQEAKTFNEFNELLRTQLAGARAEIDKLTRELLQTADLLKQAEAEKDRFDKIARVLRESQVALEEELEQLRQAGAVAPTGEEVVTPSADRVIGTITAIEGDAASINIGSAQGIKPKMKLVVYRGDQLVSYLRVLDVEVGQAAGVIVERQIDPMRGDKVTTSLR